MKDLFVYHVVTSKEMFIGQKIIFDDNNHSGVYERVMSHKKIVEEIYKNPELYNINLLDHHTKVALRELALEEYRIKNHPHYPSRLNSLYVSRNIEDAYNWAEYFSSLGRKVYQIVKLKVNGNFFDGDAHNCFEATLNKNENLELCKYYWNNMPNLKKEAPIIETIISGNIEVIEIIKRY